MQGPANKTFRSLMLSAPVEADRQPVGWGGEGRSVGASPNVRSLAVLLRLCAYRALEFNLGSHLSNLRSQN